MSKHGRSASLVTQPNVAKRGASSGSVKGNSGAITELVNNSSSPEHERHANDASPTSQGKNPVAIKAHSVRSGGPGG
jgi:hypothetical protein